MSHDRDAILKRRQRFIGAALAAAGIATVLQPPGDAPIPTAEAQEPRPCLSIEPPYYRQLRDALAAEEWPRARELLDKVVLLDPRPRLFLTLGSVCAKLADYACARDAFGRYLREAPSDDPKPERRAAAEAGLKEAEAHVGLVVVSAAFPPDALTLDGKPVDVRKAFAEPVAVNPGHHEFVARYGSEEERVLVELASGDERSVRFEHGASVSPPMPCLTAPLPHEPAPPVRGCGCSEVGR